ncbi:MAG: 1,4-dihydroxy-2-naphthoate octaprenyltransferase [Akkermansiaceae bacterium]
MKSFILAARPKTLPAAIVPVWVGCVLAFDLAGSWDLRLALFTLLGAVFIQIGTNFFNDAIDSDKGADTDARLGPMRATASGRLSRRAVYLSAIVSLLLASVCGYFLIEARGWPILVIGVASLYFAYGYTGGPVPLAYKGLGELFVILFFGFVAVSGTTFVQTGEWHEEALFMGLAIGCLSAVLISVNNLRDVDEDRGNGKNTLAVKWGRRAAINLVRIMTATPYVIAMLLNDLSWTMLVFLPPFVLGLFIIKRICSETPGQQYNKYLAFAALQLILFAAALHLATIL